MKKIAILLAAVAVALSAAAAHTTRIAVEKGERWWGIFAAEGPMQPFSAPFRVNTTDAAGQPPLVSMMFSSLGRYVWSDHPMTVDFNGQGFTIVSAFEPVEVQKGGRNLREAYLVCRHKHCPPDAAAPAPDPMLFDAPYYETSIVFGMDHSADKVLEYARRLQREGFPPGVMVVHDGWQLNNGSFEFDPHHYPDPKAFVEQMHRLGFRVMLTVTPFTAASGREYHALFKSKLLVADAGGQPGVYPGGSGYQACLDLRKHEVIRIIEDKLRGLMTNYGIDGLRLAGSGTAGVFGSDIFTAMANWHSLGSITPLCQYGSLISVPHGASPLCLLRDPFAGAESLCGALKDLVTTGLGEYPFCLNIWDEITPPENASDGAFLCGIMQFATLQPVWSIPLAPWAIEERTYYEQIKKAVALRSSMTPYIKELAAESVRTAEPVVRCMEYNYPRSGFADCIDQYMIGTRYLVAPALPGSDVRTVRLPRGMWADAQGKRHRGPVVIEAKATAGPAWFELVK